MLSTIIKFNPQSDLIIINIHWKIYVTDSVTMYHADICVFRTYISHANVVRYLHLWKITIPAYPYNTRYHELLGEKIQAHAADVLFAILLNVNLLSPFLLMKMQAICRLC